MDITRNFSYDFLSKFYMVRYLPCGEIPVLRVNEKRITPDQKDYKVKMKRDSLMPIDSKTSEKLYKLLEKKILSSIKNYGRAILFIRQVPIIAVYIDTFCFAYLCSYEIKSKDKVMLEI